MQKKIRFKQNSHFGWVLKPKLSDINNLTDGNRSETAAITELNVKVYSQDLHCFIRTRPVWFPKFGQSSKPVESAKM